jgi:hypothetical protein
MESDETIEILYSFSIHGSPVLKELTSEEDHENKKGL